MPQPQPSSARADGLVSIGIPVLGAVLADLGLEPATVRTLADATTEGTNDATSLIVGVPPGDATTRVDAILAAARAHVGAQGTLIVFAQGAREDAELAALRNHLWPHWHVSVLYSTSDTGVVRRALDGTRPLGRGTGMRGVALVARSRAAVLAPDATVLKFDKNAKNWNGNPGGPGYKHFRWMRRFVGTFADASRARRILDFGCGAGWVGIEAALVARRHGGDPFLAAFDPSPEMVRIAGENARAEGITRFEGRTGFGEEPPFPANGEPRFDLVISSGVVSFSGQVDRWLDGLVSTLEPGGTLVIGDIHRDSIGMKRRRAEKPLLPVREMNALVREDVRASLETRGLVFEAWCGYQLSRPVPQLNHFSETKLAGALDGLLLAWNERASRRDLAAGSPSQDRFDSWVMRFGSRAR